MFKNNKSDPIAVIDAIVSLFTPEELEKMKWPGLNNFDFRQQLIDRCGEYKPRFSVSKSKDMLLTSKTILYSRYDSNKRMMNAFWLSYCFENLFE